MDRASLLALALALMWWAFVYFVIIPRDQLIVWYDQAVDFTQVGHHLAEPYATPRFANPPWAAVLLFPFSQMPLALAVLVQLCLYFAILTGVIFKYGGGIHTVALTLTSFIAFQSTIELNIEWLVYLGLLLPPALSGPFLLIKPQNRLASG